MSENNGYRRGDTQVLTAKGPKYFGDKEVWLLEEDVEKVVVGGPNGREIYPKPNAVLRPYDEDDIEDEKTEVDALPFAQMHEVALAAAEQASVEQSSAVVPLPLPPPPSVGNVSPRANDDGQDVVNEEVWFASAPAEEVEVLPVPVHHPRPAHRQSNASLFMLAGMLAALLVGVVCMGVIAWKRGAIGHEAVTPSPPAGQAQAKVSSSLENLSIIAVHLIEQGERSPSEAITLPKPRAHKSKKVCTHSLLCPCKRPGGRHAKRSRASGRVT